VIGEAKRAVTLRDGPDQSNVTSDISKNDYTDRDHGYAAFFFNAPPKSVPDVAERVSASEYRLELWSVIDDDGWRFERLA